MGMAAVPAGDGRGKKHLDAELNLVPFIDLLICCICFLLITAVWVQVSHVEANLRSAGQGLQARAPSRSVTLLVGEEGYTLSVGAQRLSIPKQGRVYAEARLAAHLAELSAAPAAPAPRLTIASEDGVAYRHLIRAMDLALDQGFHGISLSDGRGML